MDPVSAFLGAAAVYVGKILKDSVAPHVAQKVLPSIIEKVRVRKETSSLDSPELLKYGIKNSTIKSGQYVEGTAFFSLSTFSNQPMVPLMEQINSMAGSMMNAVMQGNISALGNPVRYVLPTTQFPIVNDGVRVGFLYPHSMSGFIVPMFNDGSVKTLPFLGKQIILINNDNIPAIENKIVKYRARVLTIPASDVKATYPGIEDKVYDNMLKSGMLYLLSTCEDNTYIEYFENTPHEIIAGSHFIETHWEQEEVIKSAEFAKFLDESIKKVCNGMDIPKPRYYLERVKNLNAWVAPGFNIIQPNGAPYFHFQMNTDLKYNEQSKEIEKDFETMTNGILKSMNQQFGIDEEKKDLNSINDYEVNRHTILQSSSARTINDPVLKVTKEWLEKK